MSKTNKLKQKKNSYTKNIFDNGNKFVTNNFVAFFLPSESFSITLIASKKIGNAVKRNRSRRRLREVVRLKLKPQEIQGSFILIARVSTATSEYVTLEKDIDYLIKKSARSLPS